MLSHIIGHVTKGICLIIDSCTTFYHDNNYYVLTFLIIIFCFSCLPCKKFSYIPNVLSWSGADWNSWRQKLSQKIRYTWQKLIHLSYFVTFAKYYLPKQKCNSSNSAYFTEYWSPACEGPATCHSPCFKRPERVPSNQFIHPVISATKGKDLQLSQQTAPKFLAFPETLHIWFFNIGVKNKIQI